MYPLFSIQPNEWEGQGPNLLLQIIFHTVLVKKEALGYYLNLVRSKLNFIKQPIITNNQKESHLLFDVGKDNTVERRGSALVEGL